jgi:hypothetical protein
MSVQKKSMQGALRLFFDEAQPELDHLQYFNTGYGQFIIEMILLLNHAWEIFRKFP